MKEYLHWIIASAFMMLALPWLTVTFIRSDAGMAVCFLLFFAVYPVYSVILGVHAGRNAGKLWSLPFINAGLFLMGVWLLFDIGEPAFLLYAGIYLALGMGCMIISMVIRTKRRQ